MADGDKRGRRTLARKLVNLRGVFPTGKTLGMRWHLLLGYLLVIWITLALLTVSLSKILESAAIGSRRAYLYAQAHLIASAIRARGGPAVARLSAIGGIPLQGRVLVLDGSGRVLEDSAADPDMLGKVLGLPEVKEALQGKESSNTYYLPDGSFVMYVAVPSSWDQQGGALFIAQDLGDVVAQYRGIMTMVLTAGVVASLVALVAAWAISNLVAGPVLELARSARRVAAGRLDVRVDPKGPLETRTLGEAFNFMTEEVQRTIAGHEQFLVAAAHELRSPLASMSVLVESMKMKLPAPEELPELLEDLESGVKSLSRVSEGILDLLRVRARPTEAKKCKGKDLVAIIDEALADRNSLIKEKNLAVDKEVRIPDDAPVDLDPVLVRLVVSNLIDNALKFTPAGGSVKVALVAERWSLSGERKFLQGDEMAGAGLSQRCGLVFEVADTGPGIAPEHVPRIFERFYRIDQSRQRATGGTGLGLAIVKEACDKSGGIVTVESQRGKGSTFRVTWRNVIQT